MILTPDNGVGRRRPAATTGLSERPPEQQKPLRIVTPEEFDTFYRHLPDAVSRLLVETAMESGMRWGELAELRPKDIDFRPRIVTVSGKVVAEFRIPSPRPRRLSPSGGH
jgi:integrase